MPRWRLNGGFTRLWQNLSLEPGSNDVGGLRASEGANPKRRWLLRSSWDLPHNVELDATLRYVGALSNPQVPAYTAFDLRLGWRPRAGVELWLAGRNLDGGHGEFTGIATRSEFKRAVHLGLVSRF
jgi:iron complex outermembrane receptor protein